MSLTPATSPTPLRSKRQPRRWLHVRPSSLSAALNPILSDATIDDKRGIQAEYAPYTCYGSYSDEVEAEAAKMALRASSFPFVRFPGF